MDKLEYDFLTAIKKGSVTKVYDCINKGCDVNKYNIDKTILSCFNNTPLTVAINYKRYKICDILLENGALFSVDIGENRKIDAYVKAIVNKDSDMFLYLVDKLNERGDAFYLKREMISYFPYFFDTPMVEMLLNKNVILPKEILRKSCGYNNTNLNFMEKVIRKPFLYDEELKDLFNLLNYSIFGGHGRYTEHINAIVSVIVDNLPFSRFISVYDIIEKKDTPEMQKIRSLYEKNILNMQTVGQNKVNKNFKI